MIGARWTLNPDRASPAAVETARELEQRFYTQAHPRDLTDREGVVVVDGQTGAAAPARYHRFGAPGADGNRPEHVIESYPDSPWAHTLPYADTLTDADKPRSRLGIFRLNHPRHIDDVAALYNGRALRDRNQSKPFERPAHWGPDPHRANLHPKSNTARKHAAHDSSLHAKRPRLLHRRRLC